MSLLQTTAEEEKQTAYRSAPSDTTAIEETSPVSEKTSASSLEDISITARQVRPDELMAALAAIDARKNATVAGTIPLGKALERMQADVTPEEVWLEVYAGRLQQRKSGVQVQSGDAVLRRKRFWALGGTIAGVFAVAILLRLVVGDVRKQINTPLPPGTYTGSTPPIPKLPTRNQMHVPEPLQFKSPNSISLAQLLSTNGMLRMDLNLIQSMKTLLYGNSYLAPLPLAQRSRIFFDLNQGTQGDWITYFHRNNLYLRGWIAVKPGQDKARTLVQKLNFYNQPTHPVLAGKPTEQITIPIDGIRDYSLSSDGIQSVMEIRINHLDAEAWKTWKAPPLPEFSGFVYRSSGKEL